jgi:preprotein translocase subunit SecE
MKRMMQRQGQLEADGSPAQRRPPVTATRPPRPASEPERTIPGRIAEFVRDIRSELRQVAWPTRSEVTNSTIVVLITLVLLIGLIFVLNYAFAKGASFLFAP